MPKKQKPKPGAKPVTRRRAPRVNATDRRVALGLMGIALVVRVPFLTHFRMVSYDGTFYIRQALALLHGSLSGGESGAFPFGYPFFVALFAIVVRDGVTAAIAVSLVANVLAVVVFYSLARQFVRPPLAILGSIALMLCPVFMRASFLTMSESLYILWLLLGLWAYQKRRFGLTGLFIGLAAATRPEALAVFGVLAALQIRHRGPILRMSTMFVLVYAINVSAMSVVEHRLVLLSRQEAFGSLASSWNVREVERAGGDFAGKDEAIERMAQKAGRFDRFEAYAKRLPREAMLLHRHVLLPVFLLALMGFVKGPRFAMAALVPFLIFPAFTDDRGDPRWILAYVPILILYALVGFAALHDGRLRNAAYGVVALGIVVNLFVNRAQLTYVEDSAFSGAREAGLWFRPRVSPNDMIADRKPYFPFYAGARQVHIPVAPYNETIDDLTRKKVRLLSLHQLTAHLYRPALRPLVYDPLVIRGEIRFKQVYYQPTGELIYERARDDDALTWKRLTEPDGADRAPVWSPDGKQLAFRRFEPDGGGALCILPAGGGLPRTVARTEQSDDQICWTPDGRKVVFAAPVEAGRQILAIDINDGTLEQMTSGRGSSWAPCWTRRNELVFLSNRSGESELWVQDLATGRVGRLPGTVNASYPSACPTDDRIGWIQDGRLVVFDRETGRTSRISQPSHVASPPAWSPDGRYIALEADDWGSWDVYLIQPGNQTALLLTKLSRSGEGAPSWRNTGEELAVISGKGGKASVWLVGGLREYLPRLSDSYEFKTFSPEQIRASQ